jgi:tetratricopeptide (TPR) repeat protein
MRRLARGMLLALTCFSSSNLQAQAQTQAAPPSASQAPAIPSKATTDETFEDHKKFAFMLFKENHHLEALPVFQDLAKRNPGDADVLLGYGACLIDHAATLTDEASARAERLQAREILLQAKELGSNATLLMNLLEVLPADGSMRYPGGPEVVDAIRQGEAEFAKNNYPAAIEHYSKAYSLDPKSYTAALFIGDSYFAAKDFLKAGQWYETAMQINPDLETAYRYAADMYTKNGEQAKGRQLAILAVVAEPYNNLPWRGLAQWANANHRTLTPVRINTHSELATSNEKGATLTLDPRQSSTAMAVWLAYSGTRLAWQKKEFKEHFPEEASYRHTLAEEVEALNQAAKVLAQEKPEAASSDPDLALLKKIAESGMLEPYVLLSAPAKGIAIDYVSYREKNRRHLEEYLSQFVVPQTPSPAKQ